MSIRQYINSYVQCTKKEGGAAYLRLRLGWGRLGWGWFLALAAEGAGSARKAGEWSLGTRLIIPTLLPVFVYACRYICNLIQIGEQKKHIESIKKLPQTKRSLTAWGLNPEPSDYYSADAITVTHSPVHTSLCSLVLGPPQHVLSHKKY